MRARGNSQEDYLLRLIRQAADALRRLRHRLTGTRDAPELVRMDAVAATEALLGSQSAVLGMLDPISAVRLVGHPEIVALWTAFLDLEASALESLGDAPLAERRRARARALRDAAVELWGAFADREDATERT
jgi:hypothetical protein